MTTPAVALAPAPSSVAVTQVTPAMALTLRVRQSFAAMRAGVADIGRSTIEFLRLGGVADAVGRGWNWLLDRAPWARGLLDVMGSGATAVAAVTSETGQGILGWLANKAFGAFKWVARTAYGAVDWTLRLFGRPGNNAADWMFDRTVQMQNWVTEAAAPSFHRVVRSTSFDQPGVRAVHKVSLGLIAFRLISAFIVPFPLKVIAGIGAGLLIAGKEGRETGRVRMEQASSATRNPLRTVEEKAARVHHLNRHIAADRRKRDEIFKLLTDPEINAMKKRDDLRLLFKDALDAREEQAKAEGKGVADELSTDTPETTPRPVRILTDEEPVKS